jgi:hypothetical protein
MFGPTPTADPVDLPKWASIDDLADEAIRLRATVAEQAEEIARLRVGMAGAQENTRRAIANLTDQRDAERARAETAEGRIMAALALHHRFTPDGAVDDWCWECGTPYPCDTVRALTTAPGEPTP